MFEIVRDSTCSFKILNKLFGDITGIAALCLEPDFSALGVYGIFMVFSHRLLPLGGNLVVAIPV